MKQLALLAALAVSVAGPLAGADSRLASRVYNPDEIVKIDGKLNVQATIAFGDGEQIENVAVGDSESWQITPNKRADLLFVKPLSETARTNMTVVTDRHTYFFDLVAAPTAKPVYSLRFTYVLPAAPVADEAAPVPTVAVADQAAVPVSAAEAAKPVARSPAPKPGNAAKTETSARDSVRIEPGLSPQADQPSELAQLESARRDVLADRSAQTGPEKPASKPGVETRSPWQMRGVSALLPAAVRDDGDVTYLDWPPDAVLPGLFEVLNAGVERPLAYSREGDTVVIAAVPRRIVLRIGQDTAWLDRDGKRSRKKVRAPSAPSDQS